MEELPFVWLRPSLYVVWALWAAVLAGLMWIYAEEEMSLSSGMGIVVFFSFCGLIAAREAYQGEPWVRFELTGTAEKRAVTAFLLSVVHGCVTAAALLCGSRLSKMLGNETTETT